MNPRTKILFLAIDAGDKSLIKDWSEDGTMPVLKSLLARGLVANQGALTASMRGPPGLPFTRAGIPLGMVSTG